MVSTNVISLGGYKIIESWKTEIASKSIHQNYFCMRKICGTFMCWQYEICFKEKRRAWLKNCSIVSLFIPLFSAKPGVSSKSVDSSGVHSYHPTGIKTRDPTRPMSRTSGSGGSRSFGKAFF